MSKKKPKYWSKNKNVKNEEVVDAQVVDRAQPIVSLQGPTNAFVPTKNQFDDNNMVSLNVARSNNPRLLSVKFWCNS